MRAAISMATEPVDSGKESDVTSKAPTISWENTSNKEGRMDNSWQ